MNISVRTMRLFVLALVISCLSASGCAAPEQATPTIKPVPESLRAELHGAKVIVVNNPGAMVVHSPWMQSNAAANGARRGAGKGLEFALGMAGMSGQGALLVFPAVSVVSAPVGAILGSASAKSHARPDAEVRSEHARNVELVQTVAPISAAHSLLSSRTALRADSAMRIEVTVVRYGLVGPFEVDPPLTPTLVLRARVIRVSDSKPLYSNVWEVVGDARSSTEWSKLDPAKVRQEFDRLSRQISVRMFDELFVITVI